MWLKVPDTVEKVLWEGPLEPATDEAKRQLLEERGPKGERVDIRDLPVVSIGQPEVWPLAQIYPKKGMPPALKAKLAEADFYLVRLACSLRPRSDVVRLDWVRFLVHLLPDESDRQPLAFDLHPLMVTQEVKRNVKVTLSPTLKFTELEASIGGVEFGFEYPELQPVISGSGAGEADASWDYETPQGVHLQGSRFMHVLVKAPKGMPKGEASLDLTADVEVRNAVLPFVILPQQEGAEMPLVRLWG